MAEIEVDDSSSPSGSTQSPSEPGVAVVLVTADWAGPARPAATVLRELSRRWGDAVLAVVVDASQDAMLDLLGVDVVPTWLRFNRVVDHVIDVPSSADEADPRRATGTATAVASTGLPALGAENSAEATADVSAEATAGGTAEGLAESPAGSEEQLIVRDLPVASSTGVQTVLTGIWKLTTRRRGALPKHEVARDFGPDAAATGA